LNNQNLDQTKSVSFQNTIMQHVDEELDLNNKTLHTVESAMRQRIEVPEGDSNSQGANPSTPATAIPI
jgi:hypothetical protein